MLRSLLHTCIKGLNPYTKCSCGVMKKISKKFQQGTLTITILFGDFCRAGILLKTSFSACTSLPSVAADEANSFNA